MIEIVALFYAFSITGNVTYQSQSSSNITCPGDLNNDGKVNIFDLQVMSGNWAKTCNITECVSDANCPTITENYCTGSISNTKKVSYSCVNGRCVTETSSLTFGTPCL